MLPSFVPSREHVGLLLLGLIGAALFMLLFPRVQPAAQLEISIDRDQAQALAQTYLADHQYDAAAYTTRNTVLDVENHLASYLRAADATASQRDRIDAHQSWVYWDLVYLDPATSDQIRVKIDGTGELFSFQRTPPDDLPGQHLSRDDALQRARVFLSSAQDVDWSRYTLVDAQSTQHEARTDYRFMWQRSDTVLAGTQLQLSATVQGGSVGGWNRSVELPSDFRRQYDQRSESADLLNNVQTVVVNLLWIVALIVFVLRFRASEVSVKNGLVVALTFAVMFLLYLTNTLSASRHSSLASGTSPFSNMVYVSLGLNVLFTSLALFMVWISGESLAREIWPSKLRSFDGLFARHTFFPELGRGILRGFSLGFLQLGLWYVIVWLVTSTMEVWPIVSAQEQRMLSAYAPIGLVLLPAAFALLGTAFAPLFTLGFFKRRLKRTLPAVVITIVLFEPVFNETTILRDQWYTAGIGVLIGALTYAYFLRYDLWTVLTGMFVYLIAPPTFTFILQPNFTFQVAGIAAAGLLLLLFVYGYTAHRRGVPLDERAITPAYVDHITERERLKMELDIARQAQLRMLPRQIPQAQGLDIAAFSEPAREVGGDYYDFISLNDRRLGIAIGDVSGKGMPAALYMTMLKGFLQSNADSDASPSQILRHINRKFYQTAEPNVFVTLLYCVIDLDRSLITFARAGHHPVLIYRPAQHTNYVLRPPGLGIGLEAGDVFDRAIQEETFQLQRGDVIFLYTDGLAEARNTTHEEFGEDRILSLLKENSYGSAESVLQRIRTAHGRFIGQASPHDDLTCIVIKLT